MSKIAEHALPVDDVVSRLELQNEVTAEPLVDENGQVGWIDLRSPDSEPGRKHDALYGDRRLQQIHNNRAVPYTTGQLDRQNAEKLASLTVGWHLVDALGRHVDEPYSHAAAVELYSLPGYEWLKLQVEKHLKNTANFIKASSRS